MAYEAKILADSICTNNGKRITTWLLSYPRFVHAELMTHRLFSRNAASSRAIPVKRMIENVMNDPAMPVFWGKNQSGMQAKEELSPKQIEEAKKLWLEHRDRSVEVVKELVRKECGVCKGEGQWFTPTAGGIWVECPKCESSGLGLDLHKQIANRLLEPWMFITVILTATEFGNWFHLRCHPDAQPEIKKLADMMQLEYFTHVPEKKIAGEWHLPMSRPEDFEMPSFDSVLKVATARIARVSYLNHDGTKPTVEQDIALHDRLATSGHWSCFEHCARALPSNCTSGNFTGWMQYRKLFTNEHRAVFNKPTLPELEDYVEIESKES